MNALAFAVIAAATLAEHLGEGFYWVRSMDIELYPEEAPNGYLKVTPHMLPTYTPDVPLVIV